MSTTQKQQSPKAKVEAFMVQVSDRKTSFGRLLPKGMDPEWFIGEVKVAVARAPNLMECDTVSVFDALTTCAQLGLSPSGRLGSAYLIPFKTKCTLVIGYKGLVDLAYRSGEVVGFGAQVVYDNEPFEVTEGFDLTIHKHDRETDTAGQLRAVYAWATMRGGYTVKVLMWRREVLAIKARAPGAAKSDSPWITHEAEQWKKTALRRLSKLLPLSPQKSAGLMRAIESEDAQWEEMGPLDITPEPEAPAKGTERLKAQLRSNNGGQQRIEETLERSPEPVSTSPAEQGAEPPAGMRLPGE